jgi:Tol biopolymer transport system component
MTRLRGHLAIAVVAALVAACGGAASSPSAAPSPSLTATSAPATPSPQPDPTATPATTSGALVPGEPWLAYQSGGRFGYGIYLMRPDGTDLLFPISGVPAGVQEHPEWSPDGTRLLFTVTEAEDDGSETEDIWVADTATWEPQRLVDCEAPCTSADEPAWSPDGAAIAFQRIVEEDGGFASTLELLDVATGATRVVLEAPARRAILAPRWSPDGGRLVVELLELAGDGVDADLAGDGLAIVDLAAAAPALDEIVPADRLANNPDWSPAGDLIVFSAPAEGGELGGKLSDLWTVAPDGSDPTRITDLAAGGGSAIHPTFTPDGEQILFVLDDPAAGRMGVIAAVRPDGSDLGPATPTSLTGTHPRLRPTP